MAQRKGLSASEALKSALELMADDQQISPAFKLACLADLQTESTKLDATLRKAEEADILRLQKQLEERMRSLGIKRARGRPKGSKNKSGEKAA